jgi:hypothetical protein
VTRGLPRITPEWTASGWTTASSHVRGSHRMLGVWTAGLIGAVVVAHLGHRYLAALLGGLAVLAGTVLYTRLDTQLTPPADPTTGPVGLDAPGERQPVAVPAWPAEPERERPAPVPVTVEVLEIGPAR